MSRTTNINTELTVDYNPSNGVNLASAPPTTAMVSGPISLSQGQTTIVYVVEAGSIDQIDSGNTYALQIVAGQASAVQNVLVLSASPTE